MKGNASMKGDARKRSVTVALVVVAILALVMTGAAGAAKVTPIPPGPETSLPDYIGAPAKAHPTADNGVPQNSLLAPNPFNSTHRDSWNSDTGNVAGPLGREPAVLSSTLADAREDQDPNSIFNCSTQFFDSHGRVITVCFSPTQATVVLADPDTLKVLASYPLPLPPGNDPYAGTGRQKVLASMGGVYSYVDARDRLTIAAGGTHIWTLVEGGSAESPAFELPKGNDLDLSELIDPKVDGNIAGLMLDWQGRIWFTMAGVENGNPGKIYVLNPATSTYPYKDVKSVALDQGEIIRNTFAVTRIQADRAAAYVVSSQKMYRIDAGPDDQPHIVWSQPYDTVPSDTNNEQYVNGVKNGQYELGSGTSPTILGEGKYVAITDNAEQLKVVVYRTDERLGPNEKRIVCQEPVFEKKKGALSNSLVGSRLSLIATNNYDYWYDWPTGMLESTSAPGFVRIDIDPNGKGCHQVWYNPEVATTTCPSLSTKTGLLYAVARVMDKSKVDEKHPKGLDVYYWTALDFRTGKVVWQKLAGTGWRFDGWYLGLGIGPTGTLYAGVYGGLAAMRDSR
jgi:hypothetical protein